MIVLDTHVWVWWVSSPERLSPTARQQIDSEASERQIQISSISCWEVSLLVKKGRLELTLDVEEWIDRSEALPFFRFVPVDNRIAVLSNRLPGEFHEDPADRIIAATALLLGATLITKDQNLQDYPHVETLW
ncbi:MAG TPA: type II toxin-antitoxin system VapC family toxin [Thermoanaerobaculia bacterium]